MTPANVYDQALLTRVTARPWHAAAAITLRVSTSFAYLLIPLTFLPFSTAAAVLFIESGDRGLCMLIPSWECRLLLGTSFRLHLSWHQIANLWRVWSWIQTGLLRLRFVDHLFHVSL